MLRQRQYSLSKDRSMASLWCCIEHLYRDHGPSYCCSLGSKWWYIFRAQAEPRSWHSKSGWYMLLRYSTPRMWSANLDGLNCIAISMKALVNAIQCFAFLVVTTPGGLRNSTLPWLPVLHGRRFQARYLSGHMYSTTALLSALSMKPKAWRRLGGEC